MNLIQPIDIINIADHENFNLYFVFGKYSFNGSINGPG
jgi:hypothetical protein